MMAQGSFSANVSKWVQETKVRQTAVYRESAQRVIEEMQRPVSQGGNLPVDTGYLRASLLVTTSGALPGLTNNPGGAAFAYDTGQTSLVIAGAEINEPITAAYGASYARHVNYGAAGRAPRQFVGLAAQQWPRIVSEVCVEARSRAS